MESVKREFRLRNFGFSDASPEEFYRFQWKWPGQPTSFIVYRIAIAAYQLLWNILVIVYWGDTRFYRAVDTTLKWPIYLSNWSFLFLTAYFITAAISTVVFHMQKSQHKVSTVELDPVTIELVETTTPHQPQDETLTAADTSKPGQPLPWYFKVTWFLQTVACTASFFVAMGYWCFEYDPKREKLQVFTIHVHAIGAILALVDFSVVANTCRILHFVYPSLYFAIYVIFSLVYYYSGGINPYGGKEMYEGMIDWEDGVKASVIMSLLFVFVLSPVIHALYFGLHLLRLLGAGKISVSCRRCRKTCQCTEKEGVVEETNTRGVRGEEFTKLN